MFRKLCIVIFACLPCASLPPARAQQAGSMNLLTLLPSHWPTPAPSVLRTAAGERWGNMETVRGVYSSTMGTLSQWISSAQQNNARLLYSFGSTPVWASGGAYNVLSGSRSNCKGSGAAATCTSTLVLNGAAPYVANSYVVVSGVNASSSSAVSFSGSFYLTGVTSDGSGNTVISYTQSGAVAPTDTAPAGGNVTYTSAEPPADLNAVAETCQAPLAGVVRPNGDCMWAEFVTQLMQYVCGIPSQPSAPLVGSCAIRYFEAWNEFNTDGYWTSNYSDLAKMANDAAVIIRAYCGDCLVLAGAPSAGGDGYHQKYISQPNLVSPRYDTSLAQFLDAWHAIPNASLPDAVSYHAYPSRTNVLPAPFPETNVSNSSPLCAASNVPNVNCRDSIFRMNGVVRSVLTGRRWAAGLPIWVTEGGYGVNAALTDGVDPSGPNTWLLRQAYVARWMLALASTGSAVNMWYQWDSPCWGTMWSQTGAVSTACPNDPAIPAGLTPTQSAWTLMNGWISGASFPSPCSQSGPIWSCRIVRPGGYQGMFLWTTSWLQSATAQIPRPNPYRQWRDLDGNVTQLHGGTITVTNRPILLETSTASPTAPGH